MKITRAKVIPLTPDLGDKAVMIDYLESEIVAFSVMSTLIIVDIAWNQYEYALAPKDWSHNL